MIYIIFPILNTYGITFFRFCDIIGIGISIKYKLLLSYNMIIGCVVSISKIVQFTYI